MSIKTESISRLLRIKGVIPDETVVWLRSADDHERGFHCSGCGKLLFHRQHRILALVEDDMSHVLMASPIRIQCARCGNVFKVFVL